MNFFWLFPLGGFIAGFIDSIAGGGGLITLPLLSLAFGTTAYAIGTNKIVGTVGALVALIVYSKKQKPVWTAGLFFLIWLSLGSVLGSSLAPFVPPSVFKILLFLVSPALLWFLWKKERWLKLSTQNNSEASQSFLNPLLITCGVCCGFYDSIFGPGGGTFMFLSLLFVVKLPLFAALHASKLANTASAGISLINYQLHGYVHWKEGTLMALGMSIGAYLGAQTASKKAIKIVRPMLITVVSLLLLKLLLSEI